MSETLRLDAESTARAAPVPVDAPEPDVGPLLERLAQYAPHADPVRVRDAFEFARDHHAGQTRKTGEPYVTHPLAVAHILAEHRLDADTLITALLHDTVEDTSATLADVSSRFGATVAELVDGVTKLETVSRRRGAVKQAENLQKFVMAVTRDIRVLLVKLADRLHNLRTLEGLRPDQQERIGRETLEIYAPLARRMGLHWMCGELEDLSFKFVSPAAYESVTKRLAAERAARRAIVGEVSGKISARLNEAGVEARVYGREKRAYSIWRKLQRQGLDFEDISDVYAFRIITETVEDCYRALGVVHVSFRCVPERLKDFISTPKPNNYRSIHTTVVGPDARRVELQIRTEEMDRVAEHGVAAHWRYKDRVYAYDPHAAEAAGGDPMSRLRALAEILEHGGDAEEFLEYAKLEMFSDQVFTFTPKGDMIPLPAGATPLDFAYAVHTDVGDTCIAARINGQQKPLRTALKNGDEVEIIRSGTPAPPSGWEELAITGRARSCIRRLIRKTQREEFSRIGKAIIEHAFRREGAALADAELSDALKRLECASMEELYETVGRGRLTGAQVFDAVFPGRERSKDKGFIERERIDDDNAQLFVQGGGLRTGVSLHLASCCSPLPGDRIVGVLEPDHGVMVHSIDCEALAALEPEAQERWIDLGWSPSAAQRAVSIGRIVATVAHAPGALAEICTAVGRASGNICDVRTTKRQVDFFDMVFDVEVADARHLSQIIAAMRACRSVVEAERARGFETDAA